MTEPSRKKKKSNSTIEQLGLAAKPQLDKPFEGIFLRLTSSHPTEPGTLDLEEFVTGYESRNGSEYNFAGRPVLIRELAPFIFKNLGGSPKLTLASTLQTLRTYFRLFDTIENFSQVSCIGDLNDTHGALQVRHKIEKTVTNNFLQYANQARLAAGLLPLHWPRYERPSNTKEVHASNDVRALYFEILHQVKACMARWEKSDILATKGNDLAQEGADVSNASQADLHASYRALVSQSGLACPSWEHFKTATRTSVDSIAYSELVFGLYPSMDDMQAFFHLFLLRTGWNVSTALDIDSGELNNCLSAHPLSPDTHEFVHSVKERANSDQVAISQIRSTTSASNILRTLFSRTYALRRDLQRHVKDLPNGSLPLARVRQKLHSPWLSVSKVGFESVMNLDKHNHSRTSTGRLSYLKEVINRVNSTREPQEHVPNITARDFRDAFINFSYSASGYNWLVAMLAAGHKSLESLKEYLRRRRWANHSRGQVGILLKHFWAEITTRRKVDPAILRMLVKSGIVTEEQRSRWDAHLDRTRVGLGCKSLTKPPIYLVPNHVPGAICRVQRCTLCSHGVVFEDSARLLCRRLEELATLKTQISVVAWNQSTFPLEEEATLLTLQNNFAKETVDYWRKFWAEEILAGRHKVQPFEGAYG